MESARDEEMEPPAPVDGDEDDEDKSDAYGNLLTSEDNPWKLDTTGSTHLAEMSSSLDCGNFIVYYLLYKLLYSICCFMQMLA